MTLVKMPCIGSFAMGGFRPLLGSIMLLLACLFSLTVAGTVTIPSPMIGGYRQHQRYEATISLTTDFSDMTETDGALSSPVKVRCGFPIECVTSRATVQEPSVLASDLFWVLEDSAWLTLYSNASGSIAPFTPPFTRGGQETFTFTIGFAFPDLGDQPLQTAVSVGFFSSSQFVDESISSTISTGSDPEVSALSVTGPAIEKVLVTTGGELHVVFFSPILFQNASVSEYNADSAARFALRLPTSLIVSPSATPEIRMILTNSNGMQTEAQIELTWSINDLKTGFMVDGEMRWSAWLAQNSVDQVWCDPCTLIVSNLQVSSSSMELYGAPDAGQLRIINTDMRYSRSLQIQPPLLAMIPTFSTVMKPSGSSRIPMGLQAPPQSAEAWWSVASPITNVAGFFIHIPKNLLYMVDSSTGTESKLELTSKRTTISMNVAGDSSLMYVVASDDSSFVISEHLKFVALSFIIGPIPLAPSMIKIEAVNSRFLPLATFTAHVVSEVGTLKVVCASEQFEPRAASIALSCHIDTLAQRMRNQRGSIHMSIDLGSSIGTFPEGVSFDAGAGVSLGDDVTVGSIGKIGGARREFGSVQNLAHFSLKFNNGCGSSCSVGQLSFKINVDYDEFGLFDLQSLYLRFSLVTPFGEGVGDDPISAPYASGLASIPFESETEIMVGDSSSTFEVALGEDGHVTPTFPVFVPPFVAGEGVLFEVAMDNFPEDVQPTLVLSPSSPCTKTVTGSTNVWLITCELSATLGTTIGAVTFTFNTPQSLELLASRFAASFSTRVYRVFEGFTYAAIATGELRPAAVSKIRTLIFAPRQRQFPGMRSARGNIIMPDDFTLQSLSWAASDTITIHFHNDAAVVGSFSSVEVGSSANCNVSPSWDSVARTMTLTFSEPCTVTAPLSLKLNSAYWVRSASDDAYVYVTTRQMVGNPPTRTVVEKYTLNFVEEYGVDTTFKDLQGPAINAYRRSSVLFPVTFESDHSTAVVSPDDSLYVEMPELTALFPRPVSIIQNSIRISPSVFGVARTSESRRLHSFRSDSMLFGDHVVELPSFTTQNGATSFPNGVAITALPSRVPFGQTSQTHESRMYSLSIASNPFRDNANATGVQTGTHGNLFVVDFVFDVVSPASLFSGCELRLTLATQGDDCGAAIVTFSTANAQQTKAMESGCTCSVTLPNGPAGYILSGDLVRVVVRGLRITGAERQPATLAANVGQTNIWAFSIIQDVDTTPDTSENNDKLEPLDVRISVPSGSNSLVDYDMSVKLVVPFSCSAFAISSSSPDIVLTCDSEVSVSNPGCAEKQCVNGVFECTLGQASISQIEVVVQGLKVSFNVDVNAGPDVIRTKSFDQDTPYFLRTVFERQAGTIEALGSFGGYPHSSRGTTEANWSENEVRTLDVTFQVSSLKLASVDDGDKFWTIRGPSDFLSDPLGMSSPFTSGASSSVADDSLAFETNLVRISAPPSTDNVAEVTISFPASAPAIFGCVSFELDAGSFGKQARISEDLSLLSPMHFFVGPSVNSFLAPHMADSFQFAPFTNAPVTQIGSSLDGTRLFFASHLSVKVFNVLDPFKLSSQHGKPSPNPICTFESTASILAAYLSRNGRWLLTVTSDKPSVIKVTKVHSNGSVKNEFDVSHSSNGNSLDSVTYMSHFSTATSGSDTVLVCGSGRCLAVAISEDRGFLSPLYSLPLMTLSGPQLIVSSVRATEPLWRALTSGGDLVRIGSAPTPEISVTRPVMASPMPSIREVEYKGLTSLVEIDAVGEDMFYAAADNIGFVMLIQSSSNSDKIHSMVQVPCSMNSQCAIEALSVHSIISGAKKTFYIAAFLSDGNVQFISADLSLDNLTLTLSKKPITMKTSLNRPSRSVVHMHPAGSVVYYGTTTGTGGFLAVPLGKQDPAFEASIESVPWGVPTPGASSELVIPLGSVISMTTTISLPYSIGAADLFEVHLPTGSNCVAGSFIHFEYGDGIETDPIQCDEHATTTTPFVLSQSVITFASPVVLPESFKIVISGLQVAQVIPPLSAIVNDGILKFQTFAISVVTADGRPMFHTGDISIGKIIPGAAAAPQIMLSRESDASEVSTKYTARVTFGVELAPGSHTFTLYFPGEYSLVGAEVAFTPQAAFHPAPTISVAGQSLVVTLTVVSATSDTLEMIFNMKNPEFTSSELFFGSLATADGSVHRLRASYLPPVIRQSGAFVADGNPPILTETDLQSWIEGTVMAATFSADGKKCAVIGSNGSGAFLAKLGNQFELRGIFRVGHDRKLTHVTGSPNLHSFFAVDDRGLVYGFPVLPQIDGIGETDAFQAGSVMYENENGPHNAIDNVFSHLSHSDSTPDDLSVLELVAVVNWKAPIHFDTDGVAGLLAVTSHGLVQVLPPLDVTGEGGSAPVRVVSFPDDEAITSCNIAVDGETGHVRCVTDMGKLWVSSFSTSESFKLKPPSEWKSVPLTDSSIPAVAIAPPVRSEDDPSGSEVVWVAMADGRVVCVTVVGDTLSISAMSRSTRYTPASIAATADGKTVYMSTVTSEIIPFTIVESTVAPSEVLHFVPDNHTFHRVLSMTLTLSDRGVMVAYHNEIYSLQLLKPMGEVEVRFTRPEGYVPSPSDDLDKARVATVSVYFNWQNLPMSPLRYLTPGSSFALDLRQDFSALTMFGSALEFAKERPSSDISYYSLLGGASVTGLIAFGDSFSESVECSINLSSLVCSTGSLSQISSLSETFAETSATLSIPNVIPPAFTALESLAMSVITQHGAISAMSASIDTRMFRAYGVFHLNTILPANGALLNVGSLGEHSEIVFNPPLEYRDGGFEPYSVLISSTGNGCDLAEAYTSEEMPAAGYGPCCSFSQDGAENTYKKQIERKITSPAFTSRLEVYVICSVGRDGANVRVAPNSIVRTEQMRYDPLVKTVHGTAALSVVILDEDDATVAGLSMKTGAFYKTSVELDVSASKTGPCKDDMDVRIRAPSDYCFLCTDKTAASCAKEGIVTIPKMKGKSETVLYARCVQAGSDIGSFSLAYKPEDAIPYSGNGMPILSVTGSLNVEIGDMPMPLEKPVTMRVTLDTPALKDLNVSITHSSHGGCTVYETGSDVIPTGLIILETQQEVSFDLVCTGMIHIEDGFTLTAIENNNDMSPGQSAVLSTYGVAKVQMLSGTSAVDVSSAAANSVLEIAASDVVAFHVAMNPKPQRGSMFIVTVLADAQCSVSYSDSEVISSESVTANTLVNIVGYADAQTTDLFYVRCLNPVAEQESLQLEVKYANGDAYRFASEGTSLSYAFYIRAIGAMRLYKVSSMTDIDDVTSLVTAGGPPHLINAKELLFMRVELLPPTTTEVELKLKWDATFDCKIWTSEETETSAAAEKTITAPVGTKSVFFGTTCSKPIISSYGDGLVSSITITDATETYPSLKISAQVEIAVRLLLSDASEVPTSLAVDAPLHVHVASDHGVTDLFKVVLKVTTRDGQCRISTKISSNYQESITVDVLDAKSGSVYILCQTMSATSTSISITSNDRSKYRIAKWELAGVTSSGTIYLSSLASDRSAALPSIIPLDTPQELFIHLIPQTVDQVTFTFAKTSAAGSDQPLCGFFDNDRQNVEDTLDVIFFSGSSVSAAVYFVCHSVTEGGPSITITPNSLTYNSYTGTTILPRGSYAFYSPTMELLGTILPFQSPYEIHVKLLPAVESASPFMFTVALSSFAAGCTLALKEDDFDGDGSSGSSVMFTSASSSGDDPEHFLTFFVFCREAAVQGPSLIVTPGEKVLFAQGTTPPFTVSGLMRAVAVTPLFGPDRNTMYPTELSINEPSHFTFIIMPPAPNTLTIEAILDNAGHCELSKRDNSTGEESQDASKTKVKLTVESSYDTPSRSFEGKPAFSLVVKCTDLITGSQPRIKLTMEGESSTRYEPYTAGQAFSISGSMQLTLGSTSNAALKGQKLKAAQETPITLTLTPPPSATTRIKLSFIGEDVDQYQCALSASKSISFAPILFVAFDAGTASHSILLRCAFISKPNTISLMAERSDGDHYKSIVVNEIMIIATPSVTSVGGTPATGNGIGNRVSHTVHELRLALPNFPRHPTVFLVQAVPQAQQELTGGCFFQATPFPAIDKEEDFQLLATSTHITIPTGETAASLFMYCKSPILEASRAPKISVTVLMDGTKEPPGPSGDSYEDYLSPYFIVYAKRCGQFSGPPYGRIDYKISPGGFHDPSFYSEVENLHVLGDTVSYNCDTGYHLPSGVSSDTTKRVCTPWGWETKPLHVCEAVKCGIRHSDDFDSLHITSSVNYATRTNGITPPDGDTTFRAQLTVTCVEGYAFGQLQGREVVKTQSVECGANSQWGAITPCARVDCYPIPRLPDGGNTPNHINGTTYGSIVTLECAEGYEISDPTAYAICMASGQWSYEPTKPICEAKQCIRLTAPDNGDVTFSDEFDGNTTREGATATYTCNSGYETVDDTVRTCGALGWSGVPPECKPVVCTDRAGLSKYLETERAVSMDILLPSGAIIPYESFQGNFTFGMKLSVNCEHGYDYNFDTAKKQHLPVCEADRNIKVISGPIPECKPHICGEISRSIPKLKSIAYVGVPSFSYQTTATYVCDDGFRPSPTVAMVKTCGAAGVEWQPNLDVSCVAQTCSRPGEIPNGKPIQYAEGDYGSFRFGAKAFYSCESGFSIRNSITAIRTCSHGGIWSGDAPLCEPNSCGPFHSEALSNSASVTYFANGYGPMEYHATAKVTCLPGFVLKQGSPSSSTCGIDGWSVKADEITCEDINECATVSCQSMYGPGSYCINTMGSYVCAPYISVGSVAVSGHLKSVTVQYPFTGVVNDDTKEIRIVDTAGRDSISFDIFVGFGTTVFTTGPNAGSTILAVRFVQTISPYTMFSCTIQTTTATQSSQYRRITCLTDPAAGLNLPISFQFCSDRGDRNSDFCWWTPINLSGKEDDGNTLPFVYRLNYPPPTTVAATLRSLTFGDRTGRANLVGRANGKESEEIAILGSGFLNSPGAMEVRYGPRGNETAHLCSVNLEKTTHSLMACSTLNGIQGVDLYFRITVSGQSVISHDRFSYPLTLVLSEVRGCSDVPGDRTIDCPTMGGTTLTIIGDGFLDPTAVYIKGIECPITKRENKVILCSLPPGSGSNVTVSVSSGSQYSERAALLSYALPSITSISSEKCLSFNSTYIYDCPRIMDPKNKAWLVLHGTNFGAESASVYIGGTICQELYHFGDLAMAHTQVRCVIPPGTSTNNEVRLVQMYGEASKEDITLSYTQCAAGYFTVGSACELCPLGQFTGTIGQSECKQCPAGTYAPVVGTSVCLTCPAGSFSGIGANMCLPCPKGTYASSGSGLCTPCAVGTYNDKVRSATCLACPSGGLSDPDYAGCHCGAGHIMNVLGSCEPCMPGGDCSAAHTTFYNVKPLPGFYPTALATDKKAPSVERHIIDLHIDVDLDDDYAAQVFLSRWYEAIYNETGISRARAQIVSVVPHLITLADDNTPIVGGGSGPEEDTAIADIKHAIVGDDNGHVAVDNDFALRNDSAPGTRQVPGVRVTVDIFPETLRTDESASAIAQRLWALMSNPGTYMHSMFGASVAARAPVGNFGRSAYVTFEPCLRNSCVGGDRLCADGYEGPLCSVCNSGYGKVSTYKCERCESLGSRIGWMFLSLIIAVAIVGIMVYLSLRDTNKNFHLPRAIRPSSFAAFVKIIICTIQVWAIAAQYDIAWPGVLSGLMSAISAAGNVGVRASSLDCFATESGYGSSMNTLLRPLFLTSTAVFILPFLAVVLPFLVLLPIWYFHRRRYTSIMETVEYTVAWSNQIEARLKDEREKMDAEAAVAAEKSARIMAMRTAAEEVSVGSSHSRRALSSRRDLISSETAHSSGRSTIDMNPAVPSRRMNITLNTTSSRPGSAGTAGGPLPPPPRPPVSEVGVEMQSFHVNDFAEPQTPVGSERSGASQSGASVRTVATGVSLRGASMRPSSRRRRAEKSFRESLLEAERYTNKGVPVRESRVGRSNSALEFSVESSMREDSIAGGISMIGSPSIGTNVSSTSGAVQRSRSADKSKMNVEDQSAADYTQFQRDKRVYRTMVAKLADLRSYYMCVFFCCIVVAMYLLHPNITIAFFRLVGCKTVGSDSSATIRASLAGSGLTLNDVLLPHSSRRFVLADMSLTCGSSEHLLWVFTLGLAIFAFWVVGIPLTFFLFAFKNRVIIAAQPNALPRAHLRLRRNLELTFAFLFLGYESRAFYWFLVDMMSKVLYAAIMIFFPGEMHIQFLLASFIAFLIITAQTAVRPFDSPVLEQLQFAALLCTFACFFLANFFVIDTELSQFGVDIIKWVIFSAVIIFFAIALLTIYLMYVHDRETESIRKSVTTAIRRNIDPIPLLQEWQRNLANTEEQLRLKKEREAKERRDKDIRQKAQKAASAGTDGEHDSGSDTGDDVLAMAPTPTARHGSGVGGFGSPAAVSSSRGLRGIGSIAEGDGEANTVDDDVAVAGLDEEERRMHIKQRTDALDAEISSFFTNPADEKALKDAGEDFDEAEAPEEIVNLSHKETFTGDFVTEDMRRRAEERAWEAAEDAKNPILKTRKEQMRLYRANLAEELGLAGLTDAQVEAILRSTSALPRSARKEDRIEWSLHASGVQDPQGDPEEKRRALKARKVAPAAAAAAAVLAGTGEVNPVRCGYLGRTTVASAEAMVDEEVPIENEEDFFFNADEVDAMVPPHTYAEPQNHGLDDEAVATLADDQAAAHAASSAEVKVAAAASRASLVASQPLLAPRPSPKQSPTAEKTTMSVKKKQDGSTEIRVGTAKRGHVIKLVRRKKGSAAASGVKASASKPPTDMVNSMVEAAAAAVKRANGEAADNASPEASREVSPTSAKAKKPENSTSRSLAASSMSHGPASTIPAGSSNSSDGSSLHSVSQSPTHSREDSKLPSNPVMERERGVVPF